MADMYTTEQKNGAIRFLKTLAFARNMPALWLSLTTLVLIVPMAEDWSADNFGNEAIRIVAKWVLIIVVWGTFDGVLDIITRFVDSSPTKMSKGRKFFNSICFVGILALIGTSTLSIWSTPLMASFIHKNQTASIDSTKAILSKKLSLEMQEASAMQTALKTSESQRISKIEAAKKQAAQLEFDAAYADGISSNWQADYKKAKDSPNHWFWVCTGCPSAYRNYRNSILSAKRKGDEIVSNALQEQTEIADKRRSSIDDKTVRLISNLAAIDSTEIARSNMIFQNTQKALILSEIFAGFAVLILTVLIFFGRNEYEVDLIGIEFITLFSVVETVISKLFGGIYQAIMGILESVDPKAFGEGLKWAFLSVGYRISGKLKALNEQLEAERKAKEEAQKKVADQVAAAEEAERQTEIARQKLAAEERERKARQKELSVLTRLREQQEKKDKEQENLRQLRAEQRQTTTARMQSDKGIREIGGKKRKPAGTFVGFSIDFVGNEIVVTDKDRISTYRQNELQQFCDLVGKWYDRQYSAKKPATKQKNKAKYNEAVRFCKSIGISVSGRNTTTKDFQWPNRKAKAS